LRRRKRNAPMPARTPDDMKSPKPFLPEDVKNLIRLFPAQGQLFDTMKQYPLIFDISKGNFIGDRITGNFSYTPPDSKKDLVLTYQLKREGKGLIKLYICNYSIFYNYFETDKTFKIKSFESQISQWFKEVYETRIVPAGEAMKERLRSL
jgi:hypothetical protein